MRLRYSVILCFAFLSLTGWGHMGPKVKIGLSLDHTQGRESFLAKVKEAMEDNHAELMLKDAADDSATQENQVKDLIQQGIQALVVIPCKPSKAVVLVSDAHRAGIEVISLERLIPDSDLDYFIDFSTVKAGELQAQAMVKNVPKGRYVLLGGNQGERTFKDLREGQMKVLQPLIDRGDIQIAASKGGHPANAQKNLPVILPRGNNTLLAVLASDPKTLDSVQAIANLTEKVFIAGVGDDLSTCRRIASGAQLMTVYRPPQKLAEETAYLSSKLARKATTFDCQFVEVPNGEKAVKAVLLTPVAVDAKNLDSTIIADQVRKKEDVYAK